MFCPPCGSVGRLPFGLITVYRDIARLSIVISRYCAILEVCTIDNIVNDYNTVNIAQRIKETCKNRTVTAAEMLKALNLGSNTISMLLHGRAISAVSLARIADYLNVSVDYLLGRTDNTDINK